VSADDGVATFALPNKVHRDRADEFRGEVEQALAGHFGRPVPLRLVVEGEVAAPAPPPASDQTPASQDDDDVDVEDLRDAPPGTLASPEDHVMRVFEGAQVVEE
jgi:hypothetical protein